MRKFKVLVWGNEGMFVDSNLLEKGIYLTGVPKLYPESTTMDSYIKSLEENRRALEVFYNVDRVLKNLKDCQFIVCKLITEE